MELPAWLSRSFLPKDSPGSPKRPSARWSALEASELLGLSQEPSGFEERARENLQGYERGRGLQYCIDPDGGQWRSEPTSRSDSKMKEAYHYTFDPTGPEVRVSFRLERTSDVIVRLAVSNIGLRLHFA